MFRMSSIKKFKKKNGEMLLMIGLVIGKRAMIGVMMICTLFITLVTIHLCTLSAQKC